MDQVGGRLETNRALTARETFAATLLMRLLLATTSVAVFSAVLLEFKGVGISPSPGLTRDPVGALGSRDELDVNVLTLILGGARPLELWVAVGAAFMSVPAYSEVDRIRTLLAYGSPPSRALATALRPLRGLTRILSGIDTVLTQLYFPTMLSSGVIGVLACAVAGAVVADLAISIVT